MDADTRHQLKQNELAEALSKLRDLRDPRILYAAGAVVVVLLAVLVWYGWRASQQAALERGWERLSDIAANLSGADPTAVTAAQGELRTLIQETGSPSVAGYARLALARSRYDQGMLKPDERQAAFSEAITLLEQIRADPATRTDLDAAAAFLLASTYESTRQFDKARQLYQTLKDDTRYAGLPYGALSADRLATLDDLTEPIAFTPGEAPPPPAPETQAATPAPAPQFQRMTPEQLGVVAPPPAAPVPPPAEQVPPAAEPVPPPTPAPDTPPPAEPAPPTPTTSPG